MKKVLTLAAVSIVGFGFIASQGATAAEQSVESRLRDLESQVARIQAVLSNKSLLRLANELRELQATTRQLRGEIQELKHDNKNAARRQRQLYLDIDQRLRALEQAAGGAGGGAIAGQGASESYASGATAQTGGAGMAGEPGGGATPAGMTAQQSYDAAFDLITNQHYMKAAQAFKQFIQRYPNSSLADNAQYWLAETHYVRGDYSGALAAFQKVVKEYPQSSKVADALLKVGYCQDALEHFTAARAVLRKVRARYPGTTAARLARQRLNRIARETD